MKNGVNKKEKKKWGEEGKDNVIMLEFLTKNFFDLIKNYRTSFIASSFFFSCFFCVCVLFFKKT